MMTFLTRQLKKIKSHWEIISEKIQKNFTIKERINTMGKHTGLTRPVDAKRRIFKIKNYKFKLSHKTREPLLFSLNTSQEK